MKSWVVKGVDIYLTILLLKSELIAFNWFDFTSESRGDGDIKIITIINYLLIIILILDIKTVSERLKAALQQN